MWSWPQFKKLGLSFGLLHITSQHSSHISTENDQRGCRSDGLPRHHHQVLVKQLVSHCLQSHSRAGRAEFLHSWVRLAARPQCTNGLIISGSKYFPHQFIRCYKSTLESTRNSEANSQLFPSTITTRNLCAIICPHNSECLA